MTQSTRSRLLLLSAAMLLAGTLASGCSELFTKSVYLKTGEIMEIRKPVTVYGWANVEVDGKVVRKKVKYRAWPRDVVGPPINTVIERPAPQKPEVKKPGLLGMK